MPLRKPILAISMGDPAGVGPEITVKALLDDDVWARCTPVVCGNAETLSAISRVVKSPLPVTVVPQSAEYFESLAQPSSQARAKEILCVECGLPEKAVPFGKVSKEGGEASYRYIMKAIDLAMDGLVDGVVTGPIHKEAIHLAGVPHPGHTEMFAARTGVKKYAMMLVHGDFRVSHVSTHVSLREACDRVKKERVLETIQLTWDALLELGVKDPVIAVAGLNPHAGEDGLFGDEEALEIAPAVEEAIKSGINVEGPIPPDTVFAKALGKQYDAVVAMYHDQGHIPVKVAGFELDPITKRWTSIKGVNMTLGLPILRTSVDHGTAFGKAGKGTASEESMVDALVIAGTIAGSRIKKGRASGKGVN